MQWLEIDSTTGEILGWVRSGKAKALPPAPPGRELVEADDAMVAQYEALAEQLRASRRSVRVRRVGGVLSVPDDTRHRVRVEVDKTFVRAVGTDMVTLTITALRPDGTPRTAFTRTVDFETLGGRVLRLDFVNGVATKTVKMPASGRFRIGSNDQVSVESDVEIVAVE